LPKDGSGRVWLRRSGLVDEIGGLDAAIQYAAKQAKLGEDWELQEYPEVRTFEQRLLGQLTRESEVSLSSNASGQLPSDPLTAELHKLREEIFCKLNDPLDVYARCSTELL